MGAQFFERGIAMAHRMRDWSDRTGGRIRNVLSSDSLGSGTLAISIDAWLRYLGVRAYSLGSLEAVRWAMRSFLIWAQRQSVMELSVVTQALLEGRQRNLALADC